MAESFSLDSSVMAVVQEEIQQRAIKEEQQKKHYYFLNELQSMANELPGKYKQRMPYELLSTLASSLLDGTVFEIIKSLKEVQHLEERSLSNERVKLVNDFRAEKTKLIQQHKDDLHKCMAKPHNYPLVEAQHKKDIEAFSKRMTDQVRKKDMQIIRALDQKTMDQQVTLEKAGVPGFFVTNNPPDIQLQIHLMQFITRCSQLPDR